jgi:hypothetical protein
MRAALIVMLLATTAHADGDALGPGTSIAQLCAMTSIDKAQAQPAHCTSHALKVKLRKPYTKIVAVDNEDAVYLGVRIGKDWYLAPLSDEHVRITHVSLTKDEIVVTAKAAEWRCSLGDNGAPTCARVGLTD